MRIDLSSTMTCPMPNQENKRSKQGYSSPGLSDRQSSEQTYRAMWFDNNKKIIINWQWSGMIQKGCKCSEKSLCRLEVFIMFYSEPSYRLELHLKLPIFEHLLSTRSCSRHLRYRIEQDILSSFKMFTAQQVRKTSKWTIKIWYNQIKMGDIYRAFIPFLGLLRMFNMH